MKNFVKSLALGLAAVSAGSAAHSVEVVVSLKPIHGLVSGVMGATGEPNLLIKGAASPHTYQMRPSDAVALSQADLVVWVGEYLETFLMRPVENLSQSAHVLTLEELSDSGIEFLASREGGVIATSLENGHSEETTETDSHDHSEETASTETDSHDHGEEVAANQTDSDEDAELSESHDHDHGDGEQQVAAASEEHASSEHEESTAEVDDHAHHDHGELDLHIWLSPDLAAVVVNAVADELAELDPSNAETYQGNAASMRARIMATEAKLNQILMPVRDHGFIVFHDGYQYFEEAFGLNNVGTISVDPSRPVGARRLTEIRTAIAERDVRCVFSEPQFSSDIVETITEGTNVKSGVIDLLGSEVAAGEDAWFQIMNDLGDAMANCLAD